MRVTWIRYQYLSQHRDVTFGRWTGTASYNACVAFFATSSQTIRIPAPFTCSSHRLTIQRISDDFVELTVDLSVPSRSEARLEDLHGATWDVSSGHVVARGIRVTDAGRENDCGTVTSGDEVSAAAGDAAPEPCSAATTVPQHRESAPPAHVLALLDGTRHDVYVSKSGDVAVPGCTQKQAHETGVLAKSAPASACPDTPTTLSMWQRSESLRAREEDMLDLLPLLVAKQTSMNNVCNSIRERMPVEAPQYWPGDANSIQMYTRDETSILGFLPFSAIIGVNLFGPVNPSHDMLVQLHAGGYSDWAPQVKLPATTEITHLPPLRNVLDMAYSCLRLPQLTESEIKLRRELTIMGEKRREAARKAGVLCTNTSSAARVYDTPLYIRTRGSASATAPCVGGAYMICSEIPGNITVRFLDIFTPGKWLLHLDNVVLPCVGGRIDLGMHAHPDLDWSMFTGGRPDVNGISFSRREAVFLTYDESEDIPCPPCVRFMIRGTVIVAVKDDPLFPLVGFGYSCSLLTTTLSTPTLT